MQTTPKQTMPQSGEGFQERTLIISNLSADFQKDHDIIGNQDPYFVLELSKDTVTTRVMKSAGTHAEWPAEEGYRLHDRGEHPELIARAYNKNTLLKDSLLGEGRISMAELGTGQEHTVPLFDKKGQRSGELRFRAQAEQGGQMGSQTGSQTGQQGMGAAAGATGAAAGVKAHNDRHKEGTGLREMEAAATKHHDKHHMGGDRQAYDNTRVGQPVGDTTRDGHTGMLHQGATNMQTNNEQTGMLHDGAVAGAAAAGAGAGAGYMAGRNQGQSREMDNNQIANQGDNQNFSSTQVVGGQGVQTNTSNTKTNRDVNTMQEGTKYTGRGMEMEQNRNVTDTVDETTKESSEHVKRGRGYAVQLDSGDDHWQRSLEAAAKAREQAMIVERESQATHAKLLAAQEATRNFEKARREHMAIQERLAALDLENRRAAFERMSKEYEAAMAKVSGKEGQVDAAQQAANELRAEVNQRGMALNEEVNATKLHQSRLAEVEAELARLDGLHGAADAAHKDHLSRLEPLRTRHRSLQETFAGVEAELTESQRRRVQLEAKERELQNLLESHSREFDATATDFAEMEEMGRKKAADAEARANDLRSMEAEVMEVQRNLAEHRNRIGVLKQETEAQLASAGELADTAARKEAELNAAQRAIGEKERMAGTAASALSEAQAQVGPLDEKIRNERSTFDHHKEVVDEMHRKLGMAREQVDLAQARKEELWEKAKWHGEQADKASDSHFLHAHRDHNLVTGGSSVPATDMLKHGTTTQSILEKAGEKIGI